MPSASYIICSLDTGPRWFVEVQWVSAYRYVGRALKEEILSSLIILGLTVGFLNIWPVSWDKDRYYSTLSIASPPAPDLSLPATHTFNLSAQSVHNPLTPLKFVKFSGFCVNIEIAFLSGCRSSRVFVKRKVLILGCRISNPQRLTIVSRTSKSINNEVPLSSWQCQIAVTFQNRLCSADCRLFFFEDLVRCLAILRASHVGFGCGKWDGLIENCLPVHLNSN